MNQKPLELPPGVLIGLALVVLIGLVDMGTDREDVSGSAPLTSATVPVSVSRVAGKSIELAPLGVRVRCAEGWAYLSVSGAEETAGPVFMNESSHLIVRLSKFPFGDWPPSGQELEARGANLPADTRPIHRDFAQVSIEWIEATGPSGTGVRVGRLHRNKIDVLIVAMTHSGESSFPASLRQFCDSIELIGSDDR